MKTSAIANIHLITFSPTGTSRKIGIAIAQGTGIETIAIDDLTQDCEATLTFHTRQLVVITVPVYGGHVAPTALQRMKSLQGNNTPAVLVAVYGNRHYEQALEELHSFVSGQGFRVIAAGAFIGEHSYSTPETPIAAGRPDSSDLLCANRFGSEIGKKLSASSSPAEIDVKDVAFPTHPQEAIMQFKQIVMGWMKQGIQMPSVPLVDTNLCNNCATCSLICPTSAIPTCDPTETDAQACIKCCACVKGCPTGARSFPTPFAPLLVQQFSARQENHTLV